MMETSHSPQTASTSLRFRTASKSSAEDALKHLLVEAQIGDHLPQLGVLVLELLSRRISVGDGPSYFRFQLKYVA
jgi:hypothetical protein